MKTKITTAQRIRLMINTGYTNKVIIDTLRCKPQTVYNARYQINKARGLGSIGTLPKPTDGIGAPPMRTPKVRAGGTGIEYKHKPWKKLQATHIRELQITMVKPTLWQRIKGWFHG